MTLTPGTRLGPYDVTALLGEGGMGQVYRATDSHLKRQVALKVLPAAVAADPDRLARFQREAEVLAALNHPNIAAIYGLEKEPECTALVMELVEGEDLSMRIASGSVLGNRFLNASFPGASGKWQVSANGGRQPRWRADRKEIYFIAPDRKMMAAAVRASGPRVETDTPVALFQTTLRLDAAASEKHQYDVSPDGRFLLNEIADEGATPPITVILNRRYQSK